MKIPISKECIPYILICVVLIVLVSFISKILILIPGILLLFILFFFRNPNRKIPDDAYAIVSPADGRIMEIKEVYDDSYINGHAIKISIFLSLFNVHVNRCPINGRVTYKEYRPGKYFPAFKSHASELNERNTIGIENGDFKVLVHQITGFVARRIVCWVKKGDLVNKGELFGLIKFGSCTEIIMPDIVEITARVGQSVRGGKTILGRFGDE